MWSGPCTATRISTRWTPRSRDDGDPQGAGPLLGQTLADANLRARTGASVVAILRHGELQANPKSGTVFQPGDRIGFIGDEQEPTAVEQLLHMWIEGEHEDNDSS